MLKALFESFSNRDLVYFTIGGFVFGLVIYLKISIKKVVKAFLNWYIIIPICIVVIYISIWLKIAKMYNLWDITLLKDTIFWTFGFAFVLLLKMGDAKNLIYFKKVALECIKWTVIIEFVADFFTFSFPIEFIIITLYSFVIALIYYAEKNPGQKDVVAFLKWIKRFMESVVLSFVLYKAITKSNELLTLSNLKSFLLPIVLSFLYLPLMYLFALYSQYELLFVRINYLVSERRENRKTKIRVITVCGFNLDKVNNLLNFAFEFDFLNLNEIAKRQQ